MGERGNPTRKDNAAHIVSHELETLRFISLLLPLCVSVPKLYSIHLTAVLCLVHLKVLWLFLIISPINLFQNKLFSLYFAICVIKPLNYAHILVNFDIR